MISDAVKTLLSNLSFHGGETIMIIKGCSTKIILFWLGVLFLSLKTVAHAESAKLQKYQSLTSQEKSTACQAVVSRIDPELASKCSASIPAVQTNNRITNIQSGRSTSVLSETAGADYTYDSNQTELLLVERRNPQKNETGSEGREADVYVYDYRTDTLHHSVVNSISGQVKHEEQVQGVQLPLSNNEIDRAKTIATDNRTVRGRLQQEYLLITGQALNSVDQLNVKAFIFLASSMPSEVNDDAKNCGLHRCARLLLHTEEKIALETAPIVDLSRGNVAQY